MQSSLAEHIASIAVAIATPIVIVGVSIAIFLNPIWVGFDQDRAGVSGLTGYTPGQVHEVTGAILSDLVFGPPSFDVSLNGQPVLDPKERQHMADVRTVFSELGAAAIVALVVLVGCAMWSRGRRWFWRAVSAGAGVLVVGVIAVGLFFGLFFDTAFTVLHELFFAAGTWTFLGTERLIQLFPDQFWFETSLAVIVVVLALAIGLWLLGRRLAARPEGAALRPARTRA